MTEHRLIVVQAQRAAAATTSAGRDRCATRYLTAGSDAATVVRPPKPMEHPGFGPALRGAHSGANANEISCHLPPSWSASIEDSCHSSRLDRARDTSLCLRSMSRKRVGYQWAEAFSPRALPAPHRPKDRATNVYRVALPLWLSESRSPEERSPKRGAQRSWRRA